MQSRMQRLKKAVNVRRDGQSVSILTQEFTVFPELLTTNGIGCAKLDT